VRLPPATPSYGQVNRRPHLVLAYSKLRRLANGLRHLQ
jgi:hypothetical protein